MLLPKPTRRIDQLRTAMRAYENLTGLRLTYWAHGDRSRTPRHLVTADSSQAGERARPTILVSADTLEEANVELAALIGVEKTNRAPGNVPGSAPTVNDPGPTPHVWP